MPFVPGKSGNPAGRQPSDGPKWADYSKWFRLIEENISALTPLQRVELAKWSMEFLAENGKKPDATKTKAEDPAEMLKRLEASRTPNPAS